MSSFGSCRFIVDSIVHLFPSCTYLEPVCPLCLTKRRPKLHSKQGSFGFQVALELDRYKTPLVLVIEIPAVLVASPQCKMLKL